MTARTRRNEGNADRTEIAPDGPVHLVIFDFDGVIADSEVISLTSLRDTLSGYGIDLGLDEVRRRYLGVASDKIMRDVEAESPKGTSKGFREAWHETLYMRFRSELVPVSGLLELLDRIEARGLPYCIASSGSFERIGVALEAMNMTARFRHVFSSQLVKNGKPAPDLFLHAARTLGTAPVNCLVVEDSPFGVMAAKAAGMRAIGFLGGAHLSSIVEAHRTTLLRAGADGIVETLAEVEAEITVG